MRSNFAKRWRGAAASVVLSASVLPAHAGFFDDLVNKGAELAKSVSKALNTGPSEESVLAMPPEQQDQTLFKLYEATDYDNVVRLANALHAKGFASGTNFLGICTLLGQGVSTDKVKGLELIKQAAQAGDLRAQSTLGSLFAAGRDIKLDNALGMQYLVAGAQKFDEAAELLASVYEDGLQGIPKDRAKALAVYQNHKWADATRWQSKIQKLEAQLAAIPTEAAFLAQTPQQQDKTLLDLQASGDHSDVVKLANALLPSGSPVAKYYLALAYLKGEGIAQDKAQGQMLVLQAADAGFKRAQMFAGAGMVYTKDEKLLNVPRGLKLLEASLPDFPESAIMLAEIHAKGEFGQPVNLPKALALYKSVQDPQYAAKIKPAIAALEYELKPVPTLAELLAMNSAQQQKEFEELEKRKKFAESLSLAQALDAKGQAVGTFYVGTAHWFAHGVPENKKLGTEYWSRAAASGMHVAEMNAGQGYLYGQWGFERNEALGVKYLQACYDHFNDCAYALGRAYQNGWGGLPKDKTRAMDIFKNYKWNANYSMKPEIAKRIVELTPLPSSGAKPLAEEVSTPLGREFADMRSKKQYAEVLAKAIPLAEQNNPDALYNLFYLYDDGTGVTKDKAKADAYLSRAADAGHVNAMGMVGYGLALSGSNLSKGARFLTAAADAGNISAMESLRSLYGQGYSDSLPKNMGKARHYALRIYETLELRVGNSTAPYDIADLNKAKAEAAKYANIDPAADSQAIFVKVMEAAKNMGVRVADVSTQGNSYHGSGSMMVNGSIKVGFSCELMILDDMKPKLFMYFTSDDRRVHDPLRKRMVSALENKFGNLRSAFDGNSTMFVQDW